MTDRRHFRRLDCDLINGDVKISSVRLLVGHADARNSVARRLLDLILITELQQRLGDVWGFSRGGIFTELKDKQTIAYGSQNVALRIV